MITEYVRAYRDLARMLPPSSWWLGLLAACRELRAAIPVE